MHYLTELAEKLVIAYQDQDNSSHFISSPRNRTPHDRLALIEAMRDVLEQEVARGCLSYDLLRCSQLRAERQGTEAVLSGFSE